MSSGWRYRGIAAIGAVLLSMGGAVTAAYVAGSNTWDIVSLRATATAVLVTGLVTGGSLLPMYEPRPRRVVSMLATTYERIAVACLALATVGYVGLSPLLVPTTVALLGVLLAIALPIWFWSLRRRDSPQRVLVVGNDPSLISIVIRELPVRPLGFLSPALDETADGDTASSPDSIDAENPIDGISVASDGGLVASETGAAIDGVDRLSGLSHLEYALRDNDVDTVALAFSRADREEFFGALRTCRECGVDVLAPKSVSDSVLIDETEVDGSLTSVNLDPWPWYSRVGKRAFDVAFATLGLMMLTPLILAIALAIKVDSPGPVFYSQTRTSELGGTFTVLKFRSMRTDAEAETGATLSNEDAGGVDPRVTGVGRILRKTHLDEIPQLGSILVGDMSVVGPRPERPELDAAIRKRGIPWEKRWMLKPGMTGIAQVNDATGFEPERKLSYDLEYARRRTFLLDVKLVALQIRTVVIDVIDLLSKRVPVRRENATDGE